ncbi:MAG: undecaprenyl-diphosphate phosphatase, partial [Deltaproteobacteria bacterium]|nr:undecaprenyl-diphosphate phosphatase [Deltaproteobacteria bacterium]
MNLTESIILGVVQGLTEFLPISSSGHLVLFQHMLGFREPQLLLDVSLHLGTLLAVCIYFFPDLSRMTAKVWGLLGHGPQRPGSLREAMDDPDLA